MLDTVPQAGESLDFQGWIQAAYVFLSAWKSAEPEAFVFEFQWAWQDEVLTESDFDVCDRDGEAFMNDASGFALTAHQKLQQAPVEDAFFDGMAHLAQRVAQTEMGPQYGTVIMDLQFTKDNRNASILLAVQSGHSGRRTLSTHTYADLFGRFPSKT